MKESNSALIETCSILQSSVAVTNYSEVVALAWSWARARDRPYAVAAANTHVVTLARRNAEFRQALKHFDLLLPDGMPLVWCINKLAHKHLQDRVYGPTFMWKCLETTQGEASHFLLGGTEELLRALSARLKAVYPRILLAGSYAPPFGNWDAEEDERILQRLQASGAGFIWVGMGCPKQEMWIARHKARLPAGVYCAVGAAFAFHAGQVRQAPPWMQRRGLEWAFRLAAEPRRLWKRYLVNNSLFLYYLAKDALTGRD